MIPSALSAMHYASLFLTPWYVVCYAETVLRDCKLARFTALSSLPRARQTRGQINARGRFADTAILKPATAPFPVNSVICAESSLFYRACARRAPCERRH